jgi:hypothetical protein
MFLIDWAWNYVVLPLLLDFGKIKYIDNVAQQIAIAIAP